MRAFFAAELPSGCSQLPDVRVHGAHCPAECAAYGWQAARIDKERHWQEKMHQAARSAPLGVTRGLKNRPVPPIQGFTHPRHRDALNHLRESLALVLMSRRGTPVVIECRACARVRSAAPAFVHACLSQGHTACTIPNARRALARSHYGNRIEFLIRDRLASVLPVCEPPGPHEHGLDGQPVQLHNVSHENNLHTRAS